MSREKLLTLRKRVKDGEPLSRDQALAVLDHGIMAYVEQAGGALIEAKRAELKERERQVGLALGDLWLLVEAVAADVARIGESDDAQAAALESLGRAKLNIELTHQMLRAKGPAWNREWSYYTPRIEEEFD